MSAFPDWEQYVVPQRRPESGCIPTGYEVLLRVAGVSGIDYDSFQDDFDFDKDLGPDDMPQNNFESVAQAIHRKYPHVQMKWRIFPKGAGRDKLRFIENSVSRQRPILVSLNMLPFVGQPGWHIMPVVDMDDKTLALLNGVNPDGRKQVVRITKEDFVKVHDDFPGGDDVAYLAE